MRTPYLQLVGTARALPLKDVLSTVGRGPGVDIALADPTVSRLHAEIVRRGQHVYVDDLGLSANGTRVNGHPVGRCVLLDRDVIAFGRVRLRIGGLAATTDLPATTEVRRPGAVDLTRRELDVLTALCRPALHRHAFVDPATTHEIAQELVVTEAAVKQHLVRMYAKFRIPEGGNRRMQLANAVIAAGVVHPLL